jgi:protein SCO1/2
VRSLVLLLALAGCSSRPLPDLGSVPEFALIAEDGTGFGTAQLRGAPWIADFIYTRCPGPCPALTTQVARLQKRLPPSFKLVSFTVDPDRDSPAALKAYAARFGAEPGRWRFLTGKRAVLRSLAQDGFKLPVVDEDRGLIGHSLKIALVDPDLRVRGYYDGDDAEALRRLERDAASFAAPR